MKWVRGVERYHFVMIEKMETATYISGPYMSIVTGMWKYWSGIPLRSGIYSAKTEIVIFCNLKKEMDDIKLYDFNWLFI